MNERPILFNAPMVRAILAGTKTQTRRVVNRNASGRAELAGRNWHLGDPDAVKACPYGRPGDRLWVRETWQGPLFNEDQLEAYQSNRSAFETPAYCRYAADGGGPPEFFDADDNLQCRWRPSIHMPRWASRILLEIASNRVERLQDISDQDALAEGVSPDMGLCWQSGDDTPRGMYGELWESINGPGSWDANPWVWVVEFKQVDQ